MDCVSSHNPERVELAEAVSMAIIQFNPFRIGGRVSYAIPRASPRVYAVGPLAGTGIIFYIRLG